MATHAVKNVLTRAARAMLLCCLVADCALAAVVDGDPGTIGACLTQPDGTRVTLPREQVIWRGKSGKSFGIKEWFEKRTAQTRLVVVSTRPLPVGELWTADVTGVLATFSGTSRDGSALRQRVFIVSPADVLVYCDPKGRPFFFPSLKGSQTDWPNKRSLADMAGADAVGTASISVLDGGFPAIPDDPLSDPQPPAAGSRDSIKWLPDGARVSVNGAIVSAGFPDDGFFSVERSDRSFGIWVTWPDYMWEGSLLDITATMSTTAGERVVVPDYEGIVFVDENTYPRPTPIGMNNPLWAAGRSGHTLRAWPMRRG